MNRNFIFDDINEALPILMEDLLQNGREFPSRAGMTKELMHVGITLRLPWQREIAIEERKANVAAQIVETMWVLSGRNDVAGLAPYLPRAADFSDDGVEWRAGYGRRLRTWGYDTDTEVDQLAYIVNTLRANPSSRQAVATIWDPTEDTQPGKDIACNNWLSFSSRNDLLDLHVGIRSNDAMWGWSGINAFEWSALLEIVAGLTGLHVGSLHFSTTSFHLYEQHWDKARHVAGQVGVFKYMDSPRFDAELSPTLADFDRLAREWFVLEEEIRNGQDMSRRVDAFPEPMMRSWLRVIQWYWSGYSRFLEPLAHTRLIRACEVGVKPKGSPAVDATAWKTSVGGYWGLEKPDFLESVNRLHAEKHAAYGDSWKRRGEYMILANIARKIDRIDGGKETPDETQTDTAIDLLVYLAKYLCWLENGSGDPDEVAQVLTYHSECEVDTQHLVSDFNYLENLTEREEKVDHVRSMVCQASTYARSLW